MPPEPIIKTKQEGFAVIDSSRGLAAKSLASFFCPRTASILRRQRSHRTKLSRAALSRTGSPLFVARIEGTHLATRIHQHDADVVPIFRASEALHETGIVALQGD